MRGPRFIVSSKGLLYWCNYKYNAGSSRFTLRAEGKDVTHIFLHGVSHYNKVPRKYLLRRLQPTSRRSPLKATVIIPICKSCIWTRTYHSKTISNIYERWSKSVNKDYHHTWWARDFLLMNKTEKCVGECTNCDAISCSKASREHGENHQQTPL